MIAVGEKAVPKGSWWVEQKVLTMVGWTVDKKEHLTVVKREVKLDSLASMRVEWWVHCWAASTVS